MNNIISNNGTMPLTNISLEIMLQRISKRRLDLKYTQLYVGRKLGITQHAYSKIESGYTNFPIKYLFQLANVLEMHLADLFTC